MIDIVGGTYLEICKFPPWNNVYGSGLRAVFALKGLSDKINFYTYISDSEKEYLELQSKAQKFTFNSFVKKQNVLFHYLHSLHNPDVYPELKKIKRLKEIRIKRNIILCYGMLECDVVVEGNKVIYDPQSPYQPKDFFANGSNARKLVMILNETEAVNLFGSNYQSRIKSRIENDSRIEAVIVKRGVRGAILFTKKTKNIIPVFETDRVWLIGSGDVFTATFAHYWGEKNLTPLEASIRASMSTAYYCNSGALPIPQYRVLKSLFKPLSLNFKKKRKVYLAGPFFNISQYWFINEIRNIFLKEGIKIFSPIHEIGEGKPHLIVPKDLQMIKKSYLVFTVLDGLDSGTNFEIGYAKSIKKQVIGYLHKEKKNNLTMITGSGVEIYDDLATAIYRTIWKLYKK